MAEGFPDKKFSAAILSNPQEGPLLIRKWRGGVGTAIFLALCRTGNLRPITTIHDRMRHVAALRRSAAKHGQSRRSTATRVFSDPTNETVAMGSGNIKETFDVCFVFPAQAARGHGFESSNEIAVVSNKRLTLDFRVRNRPRKSSQ